MGPERLQTGRTHSEGPIYVYASHSHLCHQYNSRTRCPDVPVSDIQETQKNGFDIYCKRGLKDQSESRSLDFTRCGFIVRHQVKLGLSLNPFQQFLVVDNDSFAKSTIDIDTFFDIIDCVTLHCVKCYSTRQFLSEHFCIIFKEFQRVYCSSNFIYYLMHKDSMLQHILIYSKFLESHPSVHLRLN